MTASDLFTNTQLASSAGESVGDVQGERARAESAKAEPSPTVAPAAALPDTRARICATCVHGTRPKHGFIRCALMPWVMQAGEKACHLSPVKWAPLDPQLLAKRDAQAGIDQAVAAAERQHQGWSDTAYAFIELFCVQRKGERCIGHDIVQASVEEGVIQPANSKAWGGPIQRAARAGLLKRIGFDEDPNRHGNPVPLWEVT